MKSPAAFILALSLLSAASGDDLPLRRNVNPPASHVAFVPVHVFIDPHGKPLACYQVEIMATAGDVKLVGIEGGESAAFNKAPYYDPRALQHGNRVIIGAYSLAGELPSGKTRVATLMVRVAGTVEPRFQARLAVAATSDATAIPAVVSVVARSGAKAGEAETASAMGGVR